MTINRSATFLGLLAFLSIANSARADSVTYSFFGTAWLTGTDFTYVSPGGFLSFDTGPLVPTTSTDVYFYNVNGTYFQHDIGPLATFDFVSGNEFVLTTSTACTVDFTIEAGDSHAKLDCPTDMLTTSSSVPASGYLLDVYTNFNVVGTGGLGITPTDTGGGGGGGGGGGTATPEPASVMLFALGLLCLGWRYSSLESKYARKVAATR
ncbi:MAG TPA: PEP-CTERM sorting domain-containing protein [Candidatus Sulfopaludibacter sp.]|jgi:hypothetical protein|nr:PEP-CTERM sorting domain-containing protein [Candidatus Sulfopaludibacter sp.]